MEGQFPLDAVCVYAIQSGVDIASDGLTPLLNQGSQFSVFSRQNMSANHLDAAVAPLEQHSMPTEAIV